MKTFCRALAGGAFGLFAIGLFWLAVEMDNDELQAGKSPHSGFTPDCPTSKAFDGFAKPSRPHGMRKQ
ncbi:hypothetical protein CXU15_09510 [Akkermansia muciniphila]|nr:hypothetical protein CXU15_09510 [Akkermansia muciniphila]